MSDKTSTQPLVSIVTPVYNGIDYIAEAVQSVLEQDYERWEYIIVDNQSKDGTSELVDELAQRDPRVRVVHGEEFLDFIGNWNRAMRQVSPESKYCTLLCADDRLYPEFITQMVAAAERSPRVGLVSCYRLEGRLIWPQGTGHFDPVLPGAEAARHHMSDRHRLFACPSGMMYRAEAVRQREAFFHREYIHADIAVCYEILREWDFAFAQRLLVYTRMHDDSVTATVADKRASIPLEHALMTRRFGPAFYSGGDFEAVKRQNDRAYYREIALRMFGPGRRECLAYQRERWREAGGRFSTASLAVALLRVAATYTLDLRQPMKWLGRRIATIGRGCKPSRGGDTSGVPAAASQS